MFSAPKVEVHTSSNSVHQPRPFSRLALEIVVILAIKAIVLSAIWWMWFSAPQAHHMQMPSERVNDRLIQTPAAKPITAPQSSTSGNQNHAAH